MSWNIAFRIIWTVLLTAATSKQKLDNRVKANFGKIPSNDPSNPIPVIAGDVLVDSPTLSAMQYRTTRPLYEKFGSGLFSSRSQVGHEYYFGLEFSLCVGPVDKIKEIYAGSKRVWEGDISSGELKIDEPKLYGGLKNGGGIVADCHFYNGDNTQTFDPDIFEKTGRKLFNRGVSHFVIKGDLSSGSGLIGETGSVEPFKFRLVKLPQGLSSGFHDVNGSANPAEFLFEILTGRHYSGIKGEPPKLADSLFDLVQWRQAAQTLHTEGFGIDVYWTTGTIGEIKAEIERHINGKVTQNQHTGLIELKLARYDYDESQLPVFDINNSRLTEFTEATIKGTINTITYTYKERERLYKPVTNKVYDPGNRFEQPSEVGDTVDYPFFTKGEPAQKAAIMELKQRSTPLHSGQFTCHRDDFPFIPGSVIKLHHPHERGVIDNLIVRVVSINYGDMTRSEITVGWVQDVWALSDSIYAEPLASYYNANRYIGINQNVTADLVRFWEPPQSISKELVLFALVDSARFGDTYRMYFDEGGGQLELKYHERDNATSSLLTPLSAKGPVLDNSVYALSSGYTVNNARVASYENDIFFNKQGLLLINDEIIGYRDHHLANDQITIQYLYRGLAGTIPQDHPVGSRVFFLDDLGELLNIGKDPSIILTEGQSVRAQMPYYIPQDTWDLTDDEREGDNAPILHYTVEGNKDKPFLPGNLKVNGIPMGDTLGANDLLTLTWSHRDHTADRLYRFDDESQSAPGVTYEIKIYGETDTLLRTETINGTSYTYNDEIADSGLGRLNTSLKIEVTCNLNGVLSEYRYLLVISR